jgi:SHAQKYF class myb-like DNA-binding protein
MPVMKLLVQSDDKTLLASKKSVGCEAAGLGAIRTAIATATGLAGADFILTYLDSDFGEYVDLDDFSQIGSQAHARIKLVRSKSAAGSALQTTRSDIPTRDEETAAAEQAAAAHTSADQAAAAQASADQAAAAQAAQEKAVAAEAVAAEKEAGDVGDGTKKTAKSPLGGRMDQPSLKRPRTEGEDGQTLSQQQQQQQQQQHYGHRQPYSHAPGHNTTGLNEGSWYTDEHHRFLQAIELVGRAWKQVAEHVKTRSSTQCRTHAQKWARKNQLQQQFPKQSQLLLADGGTLYCNGKVGDAIPKSRSTSTMKDEDDATITDTMKKKVRTFWASGFYGVHANNKRWDARIYYDGKQRNLGAFDTKQEAALAYDRGARECGEEKWLNYESIAAAEEAAAHAQASHTLIMCAGLKQSKPSLPSGFYGVSACSNGERWTAKINYNRKKHSLGSFDTKQEAALAYDREARQCGEVKLLNYESIKAAEEAAVQAQAGHTLVHGPKQRKRKPRPVSGFYGVRARNKQWISEIWYESRMQHLGTFDTKLEAALAYDRKAKQCGKDKPTNYESIVAAEEEEEAAPSATAVPTAPVDRAPVAPATDPAAPSLVHIAPHTADCDHSSTSDDAIEQQFKAAAAAGAAAGVAEAAAQAQAEYEHKRRQA